MAQRTGKIFCSICQHIFIKLELEQTIYHSHDYRNELKTALKDIEPQVIEHSKICKTEIEFCWQIRANTPVFVT
jgi:uncharacterized Zn finger protein (UPF0148 family)